MVAQEDVARLLDFERGRFYALDRIGTALLTLALEHGPGAAAARVAARYAVSFDRVRTDTFVLLGDLERRKLIVSDTGGFRHTGRRRLARRAQARCGAHVRSPGRANILMHLMSAWLCLRLLGWHRTLRLWERLHRPALNNQVTPPHGLLESVDQGVRAAASRSLLLPMACKERALVAFQLLRCQGVRATLIVGIQRHPFTAHAWVECAGRTITDDAARCDTFTRVAWYD